MKKKWFHILKRIFSYLLTLFLLVSLMFVLLRLSPGDPTQKFISPQLSPLLSEKVRETFALDKSITEQYLIFIRNIFSGELGISYDYRMPVTSIVSKAFPFTLAFSLTSFCVQLIISFLLIFFIYKRRGSFADRALNKIALTFYSTPTIIIGLVLIYFLSLKLNIFPSSDLRSLNFEELNPFEKIYDYISHLFLPLITLSLPGIVTFYNYLRSNIEITYQKSFVRFLTANGFSEKNIFLKHVLPNSIGPLISILGTELGILLGGAVITETIFGLPGMGRLTVNAILSRDYPLVVGCVLVSGTCVLFANFIADIIKVKLDKRLRTEIIAS